MWKPYVNKSLKHCKSTVWCTASLKLFNILVRECTFNNVSVLYDLTVIKKFKLIINNNKNCN